MSDRKRIIVITGANSGIGKVTARELAKTGATVIMACRNKTAAETAAEEIKHVSGNDDIFVVPLDLTSFASVRDCAASISRRERLVEDRQCNVGHVQDQGAEPG